MINNSEVEKLLSRAQQTLDAAELLAENGFYQDATSRTYYAMFYVAEALLLTRSLSFSSHSAVIAAFGREFAKTGDLDNRFHRCLIQAQQARNISDYDIAPDVIDRSRSDEVRGWAREFIGAALQYLAKI
jgi:uncharacterized protein (UPF0332 family)